MICDITMLSGKWNSQTNCIDSQHITYQQLTPQILTFCVNQSENSLDLSITTYLEIHVRFS